jgi:hypothetical protein
MRFLQRTLGNQAIQRLIRANIIQAKLEVSEPGDVYEREADDLAETVMRMPEPAEAGPAHQGNTQIHRAGSAPGQAPEMSGDVESGILAQTQGGQPLPPSALAFFEPRFSYDFSNVRIHAGTQSSESAKAVNARAFTLGNHIVFGDGEYAPETPRGKKLLAHELVHVIQQGESDRGVQRKSVAPLDAVDTAPPATNAPAAPAPRETVLTNWFVDFSGVANNGKKKGRGDRDPGDVLILEDLEIGPKDKPKRFAKAGDALKSGYSKLGTYDHPKGPGSAGGTVSYASRKELDIKLTWDGQKKRETNPAAMSAARQTVEQLIFHPSDVSGDWNEVERRAADAAAEKLPDGSNPKVEIQWRGNHQEYSLKTVDYDVQRPSLCTAEISVPTTTSSVDWSSSDTKVHVNNDETHSANQSHVDTDVEASKAHSSDNSSASVDVNKAHDKDASDQHKSKKTHTEEKYGVQFEEIEKSSRHVFDSMADSLQISWWKLTNALQVEPDAKKVDSDAEQGVGDRIKNWFKDRGQDLIDFAKNKLISKVKGFFSSKIKGYLKKLLFVVEEGEAWWFPVVGWGVDWLVNKVGDKVLGKVSIEKGKDSKQPPPVESNSTPGSLTTVQLYDEIRNIAHSFDTWTEFDKSTKEWFSREFRSDEQESSNKSHEHSKDDLSVKARSDSSSDSDAAHARVRTSSDHQDTAGSAQSDVITSTRAYHGTTIRVVAGQPVLTIKIQEKS